MRGAILAAAFLLASCGGEPLYDGRFCSDDLPCPEGFSCGGGVCQRLCVVNEECVITGDVCVSGVCTALSGGVDGGALDKDGGSVDADLPDTALPECNDASDCTSPGACELAPGAICDRGRCVYQRIECVDPPAAECADGDTLFQTYSDIGACNEASGQCEYTSMGVPCADCTATCLEPCASVSCNDDNGGCRTSGFCMPGLPGEPPACIYDDAEDGTACTKDGGGDGVCRAGECVSCIEAADCDDLNPCTTDVCDTAAGTCSHPPSSAGCNDGDACTQTDICMGGLCIGMDAIDCSTGAPECYQNAGTCNPATGACEYPPSPMGAACSADGAACSADVCDGSGACVHPNRPDGTACNDSNACTQTDTCQNGACTGANPVACTSPPGQCYEAAGACAPADGTCSYPPSANTRACDDGNLCTHTDRCNGSGGCAGTAYGCNDSNVCTTDACNGSGGCTNTRIAPSNLTPAGGASVGTQDVTLRWSACADAVSYEVEIDWQRADGTWADYFTYTNEPANSKTFFPCSNAAPGLPCNGDFRFRVRAHNGTAFGPWSAFAVWHWNNCRVC